MQLAYTHAWPPAGWVPLASTSKPTQDPSNCQQSPHDPAPRPTGAAGVEAGEGCPVTALLSTTFGPKCAPICRHGVRSDGHAGPHGGRHIPGHPGSQGLL
ncbi:hypothetical protein HaLaN_01361 [Haematococcus lacustris]|uniref:Uncharacterized protein n=1 Tax=Haematococcus lacustris TaxID=44745 RepID=A0A699YBI0_HAELA|nr:hypothetical protein HaLaN_01361 [Haematococcus lacustris]